MASKYISKYTGSQIDEAIQAIIENNIQLEDFSPDLVNTIQAWINNNTAKVIISSFADFPQPGDKSTLYLALDKQILYIWDDSSATYKEFMKNGGGSQLTFTELNGGDANS